MRTIAKKPFVGTLGRLILVLLALVSASLLLSQQGAPGSPAFVDFHKDIQPILNANCVSCHSGKDARAELRLDSTEGLFRGSTNGKVLVPGDPERSSLIQRISDIGANRMPPGGQLSPQQISILKIWVNQGAPADPTVDFSTQVQPILSGACYTCHSGSEPKAQLHLDSKTLALKGGASGPAIIPGDSKNSRLLHRVMGDGGQARMPLVGTPLTSQQIAVLERWIDQGANWPDSASPTTHWAYAKPVKPALPEVKNPAWVRNAVDRFILARLDKEGLKPSPETSKETLIRRLSLDLTGLPPTVAEIDAFLADKRPEAYEKLVDRLLASPHYGERWARPWLDLARYADSNGYEKDRLRSVWPYRDWVINAFNQNMPFDEFTVEQIAGDLLPNATTDQKVATGFLRNSMTNQEAGVDPEESNWNEQVDRATAVGVAWMGSTIACAQCHNHKFDPFTQKQFYQMVAFFNNAAFARPRGRGGLGPSFNEAQLDLPTPEQTRQRDRIQAESKQYEAQLTDSSGDFAARLAEWERRVANFEKQWQPLRATRLSSTGGSILSAAGDGSISASGPDAEIETYVIEAKVPAGEISALRIEALPDPRLPRSGPGRDYYGNFVVHHVDAEVVAGPQPGKKLVFSEQLRDDPPPTNNHPYAGGPPVWAVDASRDTVRLPRQLLMILDRPFQSDGTSVLRLSILQSTGIPGQSLGKFRISSTSATDVKYLGDIPVRVRPVLREELAKRTQQERDQLATYYRSIAVELAPARQKIDELEKRLTALNIPTTLVVTENPAVKRPSTNVRMSGSYVNKGDLVEADVPAFLGSIPADAPPNRLGLAKWLVSRDNPLTARVAVNHIWEAYFGRGIVETAEDFGTQGSRPSHPELLDWLAAEFMDSGWNVKALHRLIVTSSTYRQSSEMTPELSEKDPANVLLARGARFRLEAEIVRDVTLATSGLLSAKIGGPSVMPYQPDGVWDLPLGGNLDKWVLSRGEDQYRRGLYTVIRRTAPYPSLTVFDAPSREVCTARRPRSDTPLQALTTLNDPAFYEAAQALAARVMREGGSDNSSRAVYAYRLTTARQPAGNRLDVLLSAYAKDRQYFGQHLDEARAVSGKADAELAAWTMLSRALLNLDATLTKD